jgi:polygalacturonase
VEVTGRDIKIRGRGILCGNDWAWRNGPGNMIRMTNARNVSVEGIVLRGSWSWTIPIFGCDSVTITNVKLCCGKNPNDDGINPCNSQHVVIRDCFIRSDDDCIAMKGINFDADNDNIEYITIEDCLLWGDRARIFLLGHESRAPYMRHIVIRNLDILHLSMTPFLFEPGEEMSIEDVLVEDVRANAEYWHPNPHARLDFITLRPTVNKYMKNKVPGRIQNITFKDVSFIGKEQQEGYRIWIKGADEEHKVHNVNFENVSVFGKNLSKNSPVLQMEDHTTDIQFTR